MVIGLFVYFMITVALTGIAYHCAAAGDAEGICLCFVFLLLLIFSACKNIYEYLKS
jgi:hypothetical protein